MRSDTISWANLRHVVLVALLCVLTWNLVDVYTASVARLVTDTPGLVLAMANGLHGMDHVRRASGSGGGGSNATAPRHA